MKLMSNQPEKTPDIDQSKIREVSTTTRLPEAPHEIDTRGTGIMEVGLKTKLKAHLWTLPRWFAAPFFGSALLIGCALAGGFFTRNALIGLIGGLLVMASGHSFNSYLDYAWTKVDQGETENRSAEKDYCGAQNLIENKIVSIDEVLFNALAWDVLSAIPILYLAAFVGWGIIPVWISSLLITFWYSKSKFNWTHELALGTGVGPVAVLMGMFSVSAHPDILKGIIISYPFAIILSFAGLALDEWPDAEANIKKGVKSVAFKVWEMAPWVREPSSAPIQIPESAEALDYKIGPSADNKLHVVPVGMVGNWVKDVNILRWYLFVWIVFMFMYQVFLIVIGYLAPLTAIAWVTFFPMMASAVFFSGNYRKAAGAFVAIAAMYPVLLVVGQVLG